MINLSSPTTAPTTASTSSHHPEPGPAHPALIGSHRANGKIASLPKGVRDALNRRLDDGEPGPRILAWLNALPEVQRVLKDARFRGVPVSENNLSNWRLGGYVRWQRYQQELEL